MILIFSLAIEIPPLFSHKWNELSRMMGWSLRRSIHGILFLDRWIKFSRFNLCYPERRDVDELSVVKLGCDRGILYLRDGDLHECGMGNWVEGQVDHLDQPDQWRCEFYFDRVDINAGEDEIGSRRSRRSRGSRGSIKLWVLFWPPWNKGVFFYGFFTGKGL